MTRYYFFTVPEKISTQTTNQVFGPVAPANPPATTDTYRTTSLHTVKQTTDPAAAIAVCDGSICVQADPNNNNSLNIILKPSYQPPFDFPYIKYFIYKGIKKTSLLAANSIIDNNTIPLTQRTKGAWVDDGSNPYSESADILGLTYGKNFEHEIDGIMTKIFTDDDPIDHFFYYPNKNFQLPIVKAGEKIADFNNDFGFEIVLERLGYQPQIAQARTFENSIAVGSINDPFNQNSSWATDDASYFKHWQDKEACLNYIDPCAFYGSFCGTKIFHINGSGKKIKSNSAQAIYDNVLGVFANKNTIYVDIRNDYNFSLNYFKDYGFDTYWQNADGTWAIATLDTNQSPWPIMSLKMADINTAGSVKKALFKTSLALPLGTNRIPLVYLSKAYVNNLRRLQRKDKVQRPGTPPLSSNPQPMINPVNIAFAAIKDNASDAFISAYYKINYYDQNRHQKPANTLAPSKEFYLNGLFKPLDMQQSIALRGDNFYFTTWHEEILVDLSSHGGPVYIANVAIAVDQHHTTLFSFPIYFIRGSANDVSSLPNAFTTWTTQSTQNEQILIEKIFDKFKNKKLTKQALDINNTVAALDTIVVENGASINLNNAFRKNENQEDYVFIMFTIEGYKAIVRDFRLHTSLTNNSAVYLNQRSTITLRDMNNIRYIKRLLGAQIFNTNGQKIIKDLIQLNKEIYEYANY